MFSNNSIYQGKAVICTDIYAEQNVGSAYAIFIIMDAQDKLMPVYLWALVAAGVRHFLFF